MQKFHLSVVKPIKGKPGQVMFTTSRVAPSVSSAVAAVRQEIDGSGWIVVQSAVLKRVEEDDLPVITAHSDGVIETEELANEAA